MMRAERARGVHEETCSLLHRYTLHTQRAVARMVDAIVARLSEAPAVRDEREGIIGSFSGRKITAARRIPLTSTKFVERLMLRLPRSIEPSPAFSPPRGAFVMHPSMATSASIHSSRRRRSVVAEHDSSAIRQ